MPQTGEDLKQAGMSQALAHADQVYPAWTERAVMAIARFAAAKKTSFMVEEVKAFADLPMPPTVNCWGAACNKAKSMGIISFVGYGRTSLPAAHSRVSGIWIGKEFKSDHTID